MVVIQVTADVHGEGAELVVGGADQVWRESARMALVLEGRHGDMEVLQQGMQHAWVKACIVSDDEVGDG